MPDERPILMSQHNRTRGMLN